MTIFSTGIPILMYFFLITTILHPRFAPKASTISNVKPGVSQRKPTLLNDIQFPTLNHKFTVVANFLCYPISCLVTFASALDMKVNKILQQRKMLQQSYLIYIHVYCLLKLMKIKQKQFLRYETKKLAAY